MPDHDKDLPLMANTKDILVSHYVLFLTCDFDRRTFSGEMIVTLEPVPADPGQVRSTDPFYLILDSKDIAVRHVREVNVDRRVVFTQTDGGAACHPFILTAESVGELRRMSAVDLRFSVEPWCVRVWKEGVTDAGNFPRVLQLEFETCADGASIKWTKDQDNRDCCFTHGAWINNRSLFPCQEPPVAMATWQAFVTVPRDAVVVMSGDCQPHLTESEIPDCRTFYYHTLMRLPMATLALAIGYFKIEPLNLPSTPLEVSREYDYSRDGVRPEEVACRIISAESLLPRAVQEFGAYLLKCIEAAVKWLGPYPFRRLDLVFMPPCFDCLGLASPNVTFVAQSLLCGDGSMSVHLAHEVAHAWFGLLIGASDWTEEWLSEGFATFMEDVIHQSCTPNMSADHLQEWCHIRYHLRYRTLFAELENTEDGIQTLRPNQGEELIADDSSGTSVVYVKNGMNEDTMFTQVHYLKGYFLLKHLSNLIGFELFMALLIGFVRMYHGELVTSKEVLQLFVNSLSENRNNSVSVEQLNEQWLDLPGIPTMLLDFRPPLTNLYSEVLNQVNFWKKFNSVCLKRKTTKRRKLDQRFTELNSLITEQIILLMELLLEEPRLSPKMLRQLNEKYELRHRNANIRHRWCELVIKHNHKEGLEDVKSFLIDDQAMGIYLYGELMLSEKFLWQKLARDCWLIAKDGLSPSARKLVLEMVQ